MSGFDLPAAEVRRIGRLAVEAAAANRDELLERPVFGKVGSQAHLFDEPLPEDGRTFEEVLGFVREHVLPYSMGNCHPRFFGFINATADPVGAVADYLAASMNPNCWGGDHAAIHVERCVLRWIATILGLPPSAEGILTSGGSMANFIALATARRAMCPWDVREEGLAGQGRPRPVVYASEQVHSCVDKAVDLLGLGTRNLRKIPVDDAFRLRADVLRRAIEADRRAGLLPAVVVGNAGTVNTGAVDRLAELADLCRDESLWFHVDGAYGGMAMASTALSPLFEGLDRADSVAADPHKWLYVPYEAGAVLVREPGRMAAAFRYFPAYIASDPDSPFPGPAWFAERGPELSRAFKALKVYMGLKHHGRRAYAASIERDCALARFFADRVRERPELELLSDPVLSIVVFRYRPTEGSGELEAFDGLNRAVAHRLVKEGLFFLAPTVLRGSSWLRASITNFRTTEDDLRLLVEETVRLGRSLADSSGEAG
jgi:aromatic-L-amino-acid/L-tryptophan decarboxylase